MSRTFSGFIVSACMSLFLLMSVGCAADSTSGTLVGINALTADPAAFSGEISIQGVVQNVDDAESVVWLIDVEEYESCGLSTCAGVGMLPLHLPTTGEPSLSGDLYEGSPPVLEDTVVVVGTIRSQDGLLYFDADRVERGSTTLITKR